MLKFAFRNIKSKPLRCIGTIFAIAIVVAMIFCMLSFKTAVYEYIFASETSSIGNSDIKISTTSSSSRITDVSSPLKNIDGVSEIIPSLTMYALFCNEYVQARGYEENKIDVLQKIDYIEKDEIPFGIDSVVISSACASHFSLSIGDEIPLFLGNNSARFYVWGIAEDNGYFLSDSPYQLIGRIRQIARLAIGIESDGICNEIYIKVKDGYNINNVIDSIKAIETYSLLKVEEAKDEGYIEEQTDSLTAPVVLAGAAVMGLGIVFIVILFLMSAQEKIRQIAKYSVIGATKKQIFLMFMYESIIYAFIGSIIGSLLGVGLFVLILKVTLASLHVFSVSALKLFLAAIIGFVVTIVASFIPMFRAFKGTVRENQLTIDSKSISKIIIPIALVIFTIISICIEFTVPNLKAAFSIVSIVLVLLTLGVIIGYILKGISKLISKLNNSTIKYGSIGLGREKRFTKSITLLTLGMTISMMLFMAWSLTTSIFEGYINNFKDMIFVTNVQSSVDAEKFKEVDGVEESTKMVWKQAELSNSSFTKTINLLGSKDVLDMVDFRYISNETAVKDIVSSGEPYVLVDLALNELYGVKVGDTLLLSIDGIEKEVLVGGILSHELFSGNYLIMSSENIENTFGIKIDTILITATNDVNECVNKLRTTYSNNNYYVVSVLEAYKWDMESMDAIFSLIGTLAIVVCIFIFVVTVASSLIGRDTAKKERVAMLSVGMSKNGMLKVELYQHILIAIVSYIISFATSILITASLIHALRLFGLYFEFMYEAWVVAVSGGSMAVLYSLVPVAMNFRKGYNIKKL